MEKDRGFKEMTVSGKFAVNSDGDGSEERKMVLSHLMGVRDGSGRDATKAEMLDVVKHLYFYFVKKYFEGLETARGANGTRRLTFLVVRVPNFRITQRATTTACSMASTSPNGRSRSSSTDWKEPKRLKCARVPSRRRR